VAFYHNERLRLYVQHDAHEAARRAGQSAAADMLSVIARHHCTTLSPVLRSAVLPVRPSVRPSITCFLLRHAVYVDYLYL